MTITNIFPAEDIKKDFPIFKNKIYGNDLIFLDTAASAQKPQCVINTVVEYYSKFNANVHRGAHRNSVEAPDHYEQAREKITKFKKIIIKFMYCFRRI